MAALAFDVGVGLTLGRQAGMIDANRAGAPRSFADLGWNHRPGLLLGLLVPIGLAVLSSWIGTLVSGSARYPPLAPIIFALSIGVSQIVYVLPLYLWARHRGSQRFLRGLWIGAGTVLATNIALWVTALVDDH